MFVPNYFVVLICVIFFKESVSCSDLALEQSPGSNLSCKNFPLEARFKATVLRVFGKISPGKFSENLSNITINVENRLYDHPWGQTTQRWWLARVNATLEDYTGAKSLFVVDHGFLQKSVVARLSGKTEDVVILGAHFDSVSRIGPEHLAPGVDDNAVSCAVLLETFRLIVKSQLAFEKTVEFHWYAGEEAKLLGSRVIAANYKEKGLNVIGMLNFDAVGYHVPGINKIGVHADNGNHPELAKFIKMLIDNYLKFGWTELGCGFECSDHASWTKLGYPGVLVAAATFNPKIHTGNDTLETISLEQAMEFVKLALAFSIELSS